jgi:hypothetical protein
MNTKRLSLILCLAALGACTTNEHSNLDASADQDTLLEPGDAVVSEQEAAAEAAKKIDESNADAELEKLKQEIDGPK